MKQELFGVCAPASFDEAPSSWASRAAASQGLTPDQLCRRLGMPRRRDLDVNFSFQDTRQIAVLCGLQPNVFDFACRMVRTGSALRMAKPLLWSEGTRPRYRFCSKCLQDQHTPYFPVHWRFDAWRLCFTHRCLMEEDCWNCHAPVILPRKMAEGGVGGAGITFMSQCFHCSELLWRVDPIYVDGLPRSSLSPLQAAQLANGCALVSAVAHGHTRNLLGKRVRVDTELRFREKLELFASGSTLSPSTFRGRRPI